MFNPGISDDIYFSTIQLMLEPLESDTIGCAISQAISINPSPIAKAPRPATNIPTSPGIKIPAINNKAPAITLKNFPVFLPKLIMTVSRSKTIFRILRDAVN